MTFLIVQVFTCRVDRSNCNYRSVGSSLMAAHLQKIHKIGEEKKVECEVCGKHYASEHYVRLHIQVSSLTRFYSSLFPPFLSLDGIGSFETTEFIFFRNSSKDGYGKVRGYSNTAKEVSFLT